MKNAMLTLLWLYLIVLLGAWGLLQFGSEYWWPVTLLLLGPRWILGLPLLLLLPMAFFACRRHLPLFALHLAIFLFPIMDLQLGRLATVDPGGGEEVLCVVTCNMGGGTPRIEEFVSLVESHSAQVVMLQECGWDTANEVFSQLGWAFEHDGGLATGSSCTLNRAETVARHGPERYHKPAALACSLDLSCLNQGSTDALETSGREGRGKLQLLVNVHLPTLRPALAQLLNDPLGGGPSLPDVVDEHARVSAEASAWVRRQERPVLVAGDFNLPQGSELFQAYWGHLQNGYSIAGFGFGHTKFTRAHGVRIDHILADRSWSAVSATVGPEVGGDHRPVIVQWSARR